jgi:hypothetical protein
MDKKVFRKIAYSIIIYILIFVISAILHEFGHIIISYVFGEKLHIVFIGGSLMVKGSAGYMTRLSHEELSIIYISGPIVSSILFLVSSILNRKYTNKYTLSLFFSTFTIYPLNILSWIMNIECDLPNAFSEKIYIGIIGFVVCGLIYIISAVITVKKVLSSLG